MVLDGPVAADDRANRPSVGPDGAGFDAPVALDVDVDFDRACCRRRRRPPSISALQGRLVAFDGEQVVGAHGEDGLGDLRIAGDGVRW